MFRQASEVDEISQSTESGKKQGTRIEAVLDIDEFYRLVESEESAITVTILHE